MLAGKKRVNKWQLKTDREKHPRAKDLVPYWTISKGDLVEVLRGKEAGKQGVVRRVYRKENRLVVKGVNLVKKPIPKLAARQQPGATAGDLITVEAPLHYSVVALVDPTTNQRCKVVMRRADTESQRVRVSRSSGVVIEKASFLTRRLARVPKIDTVLDTPPEVVAKRSFSVDSLLPWPRGVPPANWAPRVQGNGKPALPADHVSVRERKERRLAAAAAALSTSQQAPQPPAQTPE